MKIRLIVFGLLFLASASMVRAQAVEITPTYGYQLGGKLNYGSNYLKADDSGMFGITLGYEARSDYMVEVTYINMSTELRIRDRFGQTSCQHAVLQVLRGKADMADGAP